ncbi:Oxygen tolerance [Arachidicoccus rhizosphaerae]|uniref:Oxygen tolerance n=1 Tax=Arachidicoccus rhizosphaerae TaxID=551991 RepID=A0A1H3WP98_9BACT|nr:BatD family protein [Arachidicoccus rhizosphaerae]SDZ88018.1 Oxygen tolerance [Arachidicoccus rhizosphaerae]
MFKRTILVIFLLTVVKVVLLAQAAVELHVSDQTIGSKDGLQVTYEFKNISNPQMPDISFPDWKVAGTSVSQSTSIINGNATSSYSYVYSLSPRHMGTLNVPGITYNYNGKPLTCHDQSVKVVQKDHVKKSQGASGSPFGGLLQGMPTMPGMNMPDDIFGQPSAPPPTSGVIVHPGQSYDEAARHDFFIKITPSKSTFYVGEPILVDYEFFGAASCNWKPSRFPSFNGFSVTDIEQNLYPYDVKVNGRNYRARGIRKAQLIALKTGDLPLDSASVEVQTTFIDAGNPADRNSATAIIKSTPRNVTVLPLPTQGQPGNYSGAIGKFSIQASVDNNKLPAGENNRLHIRISGMGNLDGVSVPEIKWPSGIQAYDPRDSQSVNKAQFPMPRSLDFDIPFIGNKEGGVTIPPIVFNYFNPDTKKYEKDSTDALQIQFTAPLKDNGIAESLAQNHRTNKDYLWIVGMIALIVAVVFGAVELRKMKKNKAVKKSNTPGGAGIVTAVPEPENTSKANLAKTSKTGGADSFKDNPKVGESVASVSASSSEAAHEADHLHYLPEGLSQKIKAKAATSKPSELNNETGDRISSLPVKSRTELREDALKELKQRLDPKEFFVLAKAYIIEELQYQLDSRQIDENKLLDALKNRRPDLFNDLSNLIKICNKALYLPVGAETSRKQVLDKIESMVYANGDGDKSDTLG